MTISDIAAQKASSAPAKEEPPRRPLSFQILIAAVADALIGHFRWSIGAGRTLLGDGSARHVTKSVAPPTPSAR